MLSKQSLRLAVSAAIAAYTVDVAHFARVFAVDVESALARRSGLRPVREPDVMRFRCWPALVDRNAHMNNAKHLRLFNYARRSFWQRNGGWQYVLGHSPRANLVVSASTIRYRKEIRLLDPVDVRTSLVTWQDKSLLVEHRVLRPSDQFVLAICYVKYRLICEASLSAASFLAAVDATVDASEPPPPTPADLAAWLEYDNLSSAALRPKNV